MIYTVILAGQSNMQGHGDLNAIQHFDWNQHIKLFDLNPWVDRFGPEIGLARNIKMDSEIELWFIKYAVGGTSLLAWHPEWTTEGAATTNNAALGSLYRQLMDHIRVVTDGHEVQHLACLWYQGECDSKYVSAAPEYQENLEAFISSLRRDLKAPQLPFIMGTVEPPHETYPYADQVREAQYATARTFPNVTLFGVSDLNKLPDELHFDTDGLLALGARFATHLQPILDTTLEYRRNA